MERNTKIALIIILFSIPFFVMNLWFVSLLIFGISLIFFLKGMLHNINILNEECNPEKFFEENKEKKNQEMNCCFALLHGYSEDKRELFEAYLEKARKKKFASNFYKMQLDYLLLNFHFMNQEESEDEAEIFEQTWKKDKYLGFIEKKRIYKFLDNQHYKSMLSSVIGHFDKAISFYTTENYDLSAREFLYVKKYGGTTIYAKVADEYLKNRLQNIKIENEIPKDSIHLKDKYYLNKNLIDACFCVYLILFIIMMNLGGIL